MARPNRGKLLATFRYPVRVEVRRPTFERSAALAHLDVAKLARTARAEFEVGHLQAGRCRTAVSAVVRGGMVTALRFAACAPCRPVRVTPDLQALLRLAQARIGRRRDLGFRPMPVAPFMTGTAASIIEGTCTEVCLITIAGYSLCVVCCGRPRVCAIYIKTVPEGGLLQ